MKIIDWYLKHRKPSTVSIEISTACNRRCSYCPNSIYEDHLPKNNYYMPSDIVTKILWQLADMGFDGRLCFHHYNEPLLDERICGFLYMARQILGKKVKLNITTNGDLLTKELLEELSKNTLDELCFSLHDKEMKPEIKKVLDENKLPLPKIEIKDMSRFTKFYNRGGLVSIPKNKLKQFSGCDKSTHIMINALGDVIICCNDYFGQYRLGNVNSTPINQIWKSTQRLRRRIFLGKYDLEICKKCSYEI